MVQSPLFEAIRAGDRAMVESLLAEGVDPNTVNERGETALHAACRLDTTVVEHDPDIDILELRDNIRYLSQAAAWQVALVRLLLDRGADVQARDGAGRTPLHAAAAMETMVTYVHARDPDGDNIQTGGEIDTAPVVRMLLERGADPNALDGQGATPQLLACRVDPAWGTAPSAVIRALLEAGADVNLADARGQTALSATVVNGNAEAARLLLASGAKVAAQDHDGMSALDYARERGDRKLIKVLEAGGARVGKPDHRELFEAVERGDLKRVQASPAKGADPHRAFRQRDAFAAALDHGDPAIVQKSGDTLLVSLVSWASPLFLEGQRMSRASSQSAWSSSSARSAKSTTRSSRLAPARSTEMGTGA